MKKKIKSYLIQLSMLTGLLLIGFLLHVGMVQPKDLQLLISCYSFNWVWTLGFLALVFLGSEKRLQQLGFLFLYLSLAKFAFFLFLIKPMLTLDRGVRSEHFAFFFIPYAFSMVFETISTVRNLNTK